MEEAQEREGYLNSFASSSSGEKSGPCPHYGDTVFMEEQILLSDLIPRRLMGVVVAVLIALGAIATIVSLHCWAATVADRFPADALSMFSFAEVGNLAQWFSSLAALAAAGASLMVFTIRRQRNDDYHGHYRVWLWAALCWFLLATDIAVGLHRSLQWFLVHLTGTPLWREGVLWWIIPYTIAFAALGSRLVMDMWPCRSSIAAFVLAPVGYAAALLAGLNVMPEQWATQALAIRVGAAMFGHLMLLTSMVLQSRYVVLDFEGVLPKRAKKPAKPKRIVLKKAEKAEKEEEESSSPWHRVDSAQGTPQPVLRREPAPAFTSFDDDDDDDVPNPTNRKLTKQEKKALKERLLRERMEREKKQSRW
jgi:hypothetical protein